VYSTDVTSSVAPKLNVIPFPSAVAPDIDYPIAALKNASDAKGAQAFVDYILSPKGKRSSRRKASSHRRDAEGRGPRRRLTFFGWSAATAQTPAPAKRTPAPPPAPFHVLINAATLAVYRASRFPPPTKPTHQQIHRFSLHDLLVKEGARPASRCARWRCSAIFWSALPTVPRPLHAGRTRPVIHRSRGGDRGSNRRRTVQGRRPYA